MTVDYGSNPNLDHWVRDDPHLQEKMIAERQNDNQLILSLGSATVNSVNRAASTISTDERGGLSERDRLAVPLNERGERVEWPWYMDEDEGKTYAKLSKPAYWRKMGPKGRTSATAVRGEYEKLMSRIHSLEVDCSQLNQDGDQNERAIIESRIADWLGIKEMIDEAPNTRDIRILINRE